MPWWIWLILVLFMVAMIVAGCVYVLQHGLRAMHVMSGPGGAQISSCLGILHDYKGSFSREEVERVFTVPLRWFAGYTPRTSDGAMVVETAKDFPYELLPGGENYPWHKIPRRFYFYESSGGVIWGVTAELLYHCLKELGVSPL